MTGNANHLHNSSTSLLTPHSGPHLRKARVLVHDVLVRLRPRLLFEWRVAHEKLKREDTNCPCIDLRGRKEKGGDITGGDNERRPLGTCVRVKERGSAKGVAAD